MSRLRWAKWFWADWSNDTALNLCSIPARGLWMALLCIAAQGDPYGAINVKGRPPSEAELIDLCRMKKGPHATRDFRRWLAELERNGVCAWADVVPVSAPYTHPIRTLTSPRMHHDGTLAMVRSNASRQRWKLAKNGQSPDDLHMQKAESGADLHMQKSGFASTESEAEAEADEDSPRSPRKAGARADGSNARAQGTNPRANGVKPRRRESRNAMIDIIREEMEEEPPHDESNARQRGAQVVPIAGRIVRRVDEP